MGEIKNNIDAGKNFVLLDVRTSEEFNAGHLPKCINIPRGASEFLIGKFYPNKDTEIILYCRADARATLCTNTLKVMGYNNVKNLKDSYLCYHNFLKGLIFAYYLSKFYFYMLPYNGRSVYSQKLTISF